MAKVTPQEEVVRLQAEVEKLTKALSAEVDARGKAEDEARAAASAQGVAFMQREIQEVPTGKKVTVQRCERYETKGYKDDGTPIQKPIFKDVELPTYFYKIDLPPSGGTAVKINGEGFYHGETYELDLDLLRTIKDIVHRSWAHEATIKGSNENAYRRPQNRVLSGAGRAA